VAAQNETKPIKNVSLHPKTKIRWPLARSFGGGETVHEGELSALGKIQSILDTKSKKPRFKIY